MESSSENTRAIQHCWKIQTLSLSKANHLRLQIVLLVKPCWKFFFWLLSTVVLLFFEHTFATSSLALPHYPEVEDGVAVQHSSLLSVDWDLLLRRQHLYRGGKQKSSHPSRNNFLRELLPGHSLPKGCLGPALDPLPSTTPAAVLQAVKVPSVVWVSEDYRINAYSTIHFVTVSEHYTSSPV